LEFFFNRQHGLNKRAEAKKKIKILLLFIYWKNGHLPYGCKKKMNYRCSLNIHIWMGFVLLGS